MFNSNCTPGVLDVEVVLPALQECRRVIKCVGLHSKSADLGKHDIFSDCTPGVLYEYIMHDGMRLTTWSQTGRLAYDFYCQIQGI